MATKIIFDKYSPSTVKFGDLKKGDAFEFEDKLYLKLEKEVSLRVVGSQALEAFGTTCFHADIVVEPLDVEIKFSRK